MTPPTRRVCPAGSVPSHTRAPDTKANQNSISRPKQNINRAELGKVNFVRVKALERQVKALTFNGSKELASLTY